MITLTNLTAEIDSTSEFCESRGILHTVHDEPVRGFFRRASLGASGLVLRRGDDAVAIPMAELWKLAEQHELRLRPDSTAKNAENLKTSSSAIFAIFAVTFFLLGFSASAQISYPRTNVCAGYTVLPATTAQSLGFSTNEITLYRDRGLSLFSTAVATNASTALVTIRMDVSYNGSNWTTTTPLQWSYPLSGTSPVTAWTNFPPSVLDNVKKARVSSVSNAHSASIHFTNVISSISP
jgi:hypothetical protein